MAGWRLGILVVLVSVGGRAPADTDPPVPPSVTPPPLPISANPNPRPAPPDIPPLGLPTFAQIEGMPSGKTVSGPLQPVLLPGAAAGAPFPPGYLPAPGPPILDPKPLPHTWATWEYLLWWPKGAPLPPLVTASRGANVPRVGGTNTALLLGGGAAESPDSSGGRFTYGFAVSEDNATALSVSYFFLGTRTVTDSVSDPTLTRSVGRPIVNPATGGEDAIAVSGPGVNGVGRLRGAVSVATSTRVTGWEVNGLINLVNGPQARLHALAGYRYFQTNEGLRVTQSAAFPQAPAGERPVELADQFDGRNRFHGAQLGLAADIVHGALFLEMTGKVALGQANGFVGIHGYATGPAGASPVGVLAQPSNSGQFSRTAFAVLPEGTLKVGYRFENRSRVYLGYNLIYLSEAVRPGEQIDRTIDATAVPYLGSGLPSANTDRPGAPFARGDFWVQGLVVGLEYRY